MMQLTDIETFVVGNPPPHFGGRYFVFVKLTTNTGVSGIGEGYCVPFSPHLVAKMIEDVFARYVAGNDPHDIETMWRRVTNYESFNVSEFHSSNPLMTLISRKSCRPHSPHSRPLPDCLYPPKGEA